MNGLKEIFKERCINVSEFAKKIGVPKTTMYTALDKTKTGRMSIDLYLKICEGLGEDPRAFYDDICARERVAYHAVKLEGETDD